MATEPAAQVVAYGERLAVYLDHCADYQRSEDPEFFLWNARRSAEAALIMVVLHAGGKIDSNTNPKTVSTLETVLKHLDVGMDSAVSYAISSVQKLGNAGSHAGLRSVHMSTVSKNAAPSVVVLVRWMIDLVSLPDDLRTRLLALSTELENESRPPLLSREQTNALEAKAQHLSSALHNAQTESALARSDRDKLAAEVRTTQAVRDELRLALIEEKRSSSVGSEERRQIQRELATKHQELQAYAATLVAREAQVAKFRQQAQDAHATLLEINKEREQITSIQSAMVVTESKNKALQQRLITLEKELTAVGTALASSRSEQEVTARERDQLRSSQRRWIVGLSTVAAGFGMAVFVLLVAQTIRPFRAAIESPSAQAAALALSSPQVTTATPPPPSAPPPPPTCPAGTRLFEATTVHIGQPIGQRVDWPRPNPKEISPIAVDAFCIDRVPVRAADLQIDSPTYRSFNSDDCVDMGSTNADRGAATCVTRDEAERYCKARGQRLPRIEEWEAIARSEGRAQLSTDLPAEWVADRFPIALFNLRDAAWTKGDGVFRLGSLDEKVKAREISAAGDVLYSWNQNPPDRRLSNRGFRCAQAL